MIQLTDLKISFALTAVQQAARLAAEIQREMVTPALTKQDRSPVTVADFAAQAVVGYYLNKRFPEARLVGEENAAVLREPSGLETLETVTTYLSRVVPGISAEETCDLIDRGSGASGDAYWTLDPIDGTKGFLREAQYATALAYVEGKEVQIGVLGCPNFSPSWTGSSPKGGVILAAKKGQGSWIARLGDALPELDFQKLRVSSSADPTQARLLRSFESGHTNPGQLDAFQAALASTAQPVRLDSQVKYALLAGGGGEIYLRLLSPEKPQYREKIWDQAAGALIVEEAGGKVTDLEGKPLDFSQGRTLAVNRGLCATNGILHEAALDALRKIQV